LLNGEENHLSPFRQAGKSAQPTFPKPDLRDLQQFTPIVEETRAYGGLLQHHINNACAE